MVAIIYHNIITNKSKNTVHYIFVCLQLLSPYSAVALVLPISTVVSVATGLFKFSPDFVSKKTQKNPGIENYIQSSKIKGYKPTTSVDTARY